MSEKIAVHCKTEELFDKVRMKANIGDGHRWGMFRSESCINLGVGSQSVRWYQDADFTIISAEEYLKEGEVEFKVGDRVRCIDSSGLDIHIAGTYIIHDIKFKPTEIGLSLEGCPKDNYYKSCRFEVVNSQTKPKKENTMNKNIVVAFPKTDDAVLVEEQLGSEIKEGFINGLVIKQYAKEILTEAKNRKAEEDK